MARVPEPKTRLTLLERLKSSPQDVEAWSEFVEWYGQKIFVWCRAWGLQEADANDVTQDVFLKLSGRMQDFCYNPQGSFRAWLKTVTHHAWLDHLSHKRKAGEGSGSQSAFDLLATIEARDDLVRRIADAADQELFKEAAARVQLRVEPRTWKAFRLLAVEGLSGAAAAERLGMKVASVFVRAAKCSGCCAKKWPGSTPNDAGAAAGWRMAMSDCPSRQQLRDLLREEVRGDDLSRIFVHVEECALCQQSLFELTDGEAGLTVRDLQTHWVTPVPKRRTTFPWPESTARRAAPAYPTGRPTWKGTSC